MAKQELTTIDESANLPAHLAATKGQGTGLKGLHADDYIVPRIKLLQGISDEVKAGLPGAEAGVYWLTVLDKPLGSEFNFVTINNKVRVLLLAPRDDGQGILARAEDGETWNTLGEWNVKIKNIRQPQKWAITDLDVTKSGLLNFGTSINDDKDSVPAATKFFDYLIYLPDFDLIAVLSLARSQAKKAKDLNGKITLSRVDMRGLLLKAKIITETNGADSFSNYQFTLNGYATKEVYDIAKGYEKAFQTFKTDESGLTGETDTSTVQPSDSKEY